MPCTRLWIGGSPPGVGVSPSFLPAAIRTPVAIQIPMAIHIHYDSRPRRLASMAIRLTWFGPQGVSTNLMEFAWKTHLRVLHPTPASFSRYMGVARCPCLPPPPPLPATHTYNPGQSPTKDRI